MKETDCPFVSWSELFLQPPLPHYVSIFEGELFANSLKVWIICNHISRNNPNPKTWLFAFTTLDGKFAFCPWCAAGPRGWKGVRLKVCLFCKTNCPTIRTPTTKWTDNDGAENVARALLEIALSCSFNRSIINTWTWHILILHYCLTWIRYD